MAVNTDKIEVVNNNTDNDSNEQVNKFIDNTNEPTKQAIKEHNFNYLVNPFANENSKDKSETENSKEPTPKYLETVYNTPGTRLNLDELLGGGKGFQTQSKQQDKVEFLCIKRKRDTDAVPVLVVDNIKRGREDKKSKTYELQCTTEGESFLKGLPNTVKSTISDLVSGKSKVSPISAPPISDEIPKPITGKRPRFKVIGKETLPFEASEDSIIYNVEYDFDYDQTIFKGPSHKKQMSTQTSEDLELMREFQKLELDQSGYVYDIYKINRKANIVQTDFAPFGLLNMNQFGDSDMDIEDDSDRMTDDYDSNDENHFANDYPDEDYEFDNEEEYNYEAYDSSYEEDGTPGNHFDFVEPKNSRVKDMYDDDLYHDVETSQKFSNFNDLVMDYGDKEHGDDEDEDVSPFYGSRITRVVENDYDNSARSGGSYGLDYDD